MKGHSRRHMVYIRTAIREKKYYLIPDYFKAMKVIWIGKGLDGLLRRRNEEGDFFQSGLDLVKRYPP